MKLQQIILKVLEDAYPDFVYGYDLEKLNTKWEYIGTSATRRCRELIETGQIENKIVKGFIKYRIKKEMKQRVLIQDKNSILRAL